MASTLSVIVPAFNSAEFVAATIASIAAQHHRPDELIVVDDGSTDDTADVAALALARVTFPTMLLRQPNGGVAVARNAGILASRGDLIACVDADDLLEPEHFATVCSLLAAHPEAVAAFSDVREFDAEGARPHTIRSKTMARRRGIGTTPAAVAGASVLGSGLTGALLLGNFITNSATIIRRTALAKSGTFDPAFTIGEDRDLYMRLSLLGPFVESERVTARQRRHPASTMATRNNLQWSETSLRLLAAFRDRHPVPVGEPALRDAFRHARDTWLRVAMDESSRAGVSTLRATVRRCRELGFRARPGPWRWVRAIAAALLPQSPAQRGVSIGAGVPTQNDR